MLHVIKDNKNGVSLYQNVKFYLYINHGKAFPIKITNTFWYTVFPSFVFYGKNSGQTKTEKKEPNKQTKQKQNKQKTLS